MVEKTSMVAREIPGSSFGKYGIMLMEELYSRLGIHTYHNYIIKKDDKDISYYMIDPNALKISSRNYLELHSKIIDENSNKVARDSFEDDELDDINLIKESLAMDFDSDKMRKLLNDFYRMYGVNALTSSECDRLDDWEFLFDKFQKNSICFVAKSNNPGFCGFNFLSSSDTDSEAVVDDRFLDNIVNGRERMQRFVEMINNDFSYANPVVEELCSISPEEIVQAVEKNRNVVIPRACVELFVHIVTENQRLLKTLISVDNNLEETHKTE